MISDKLNDDLKLAMKAGDKAKLSVVRMLMSELKYARISKGDALSEDEEAKVVASYAKKRNEAIDQYREAGRSELAEKEKAELDLTMSYLPPQLDEAALTEIVKKAIADVGAESAKDFGQVMKAAMQTIGSQADGKTVSAIVKQLLG